MLEEREETGNMSKSEPFCGMTGKGNRLNSGGIGLDHVNEPISLNSFHRNEIKKVLYKEKPTATLGAESDGFKYYFAETSKWGVIFQIPFDESKEFGSQEPAQLLIRWIHSVEPIKIKPCADDPISTKGKNIAIHWNDYHSLTNLQETCIRLGIPKSGNPELDALILESERKRIAIDAMGGILAKYNELEPVSENTTTYEIVVYDSIAFANELLKQLGYE